MQGRDAAEHSVASALVTALSKAKKLTSHRYIFSVDAPKMIDRHGCCSGVENCFGQKSKIFCNHGGPILLEGGSRISINQNRTTKSTATGRYAQNWL